MDSFKLFSLTKDLFTSNFFETAVVMVYYVWLTAHLLNLGHPDNENQSDSKTETIGCNIFNSSQSNALFSNLANQMPGTKQGNLSVFVVTLPPLQCLLINCQAQTINSFACLWV